MKENLCHRYVLLAITVLVVACTTQTSPNSILSDASTSPLDTETAISSTPTTIVSSTATFKPVNTLDHGQLVTALPSIGANSLTVAAESSTTSTATQMIQGSTNATIFYYSSDGHLYRTSVSNGVGEKLTIQPLSGASDSDAIGSVISYRPPQVSPDGRLLALNGNWGGAAVLDLVTGESIGIGRGQAMLAPSWSADSRHISYISQDDQLCIYDLNNEPDDCPFQSTGLQDAMWSPSGATIAVAILDPIAEGNSNCCTGKVWLVNVLNSEITEVGTYATGFESVPGEIIAWLVDGSGLVIKKTSDGRGALYNLADDSMTYFEEAILSVSPSGQVVLHPSGVFAHIEDRAARLSLPATADCDGYLSLIHAWSPDGQRLAYAPACWIDGELREEPRILYVVETTRGNLLWQLELPPAIVPAGWSSDGAYILMDDGDNHSPIWRLPADGVGEPEIVVEDGYLLEVVKAWE